MALDIEGLTVRDVVIETRQAPNPEPGGGTFVTVADAVRGVIDFSDGDVIDWSGRNDALGRLKAALAAEYGPGRYEGGIGSPEAPDNPFVGYFGWVIAR